MAVMLCGEEWTVGDPWSHFFAVIVPSRLIIRVGVVSSLEGCSTLFGCALRRLYSQLGETPSLSLCRVRDPLEELSGARL